MAPSLPNEILELIVEELVVAGKGPWKGLLKDLKSCCLVSKVFAPLCQKHIFSSIDLHPGRTFMSGQVSLPNTTQRWAELLNEYRYKDGHPGIYVRKLKYHVVVPDDVRNQLVVNALQMMPNLTELDLRVKNTRGGVRFADCGPYWRNAVLCMIQQPKLKSLLIRNLRFPVESLLWSPSLEVLDIRDSWRPGLAKPRKDPVARGWPSLAHVGQPEWRNGPEQQCLYPRTLKIDSMSGVDTGVFIRTKQEGRDQMQRHGVIRLDCVQDLHFIVEGFYDYDVASYVFENVQTLRVLTIQMNVQTNEDTVIPDFPLNNLNTSTFATLAHLNLSIMNARDWEGTPLDDPYMGFGQVALTNLTALKDLNLDIWIIDIVDLPETAYGPQWESLDQALVADGLPVCRLPTLECVRMRVYLKVWDNSNNVGGTLVDAEESLANINTRVYPRRFPGLTRLAGDGALTFSFEAGMKVVPRDAPGHYHQTDQWRRHNTWPHW